MFEEVMEIFNDDMLFVIVDIYKLLFVMEEWLVNKIEYIVVIDYYCRGEEFIRDLLFVYMELYVLLIVELVIELFEYQLKCLKINMIEVIVLLVGIIVDIKSFFFCIGLWIFDVVFYLRVKGVDMVFVQKFLKEIVDFYIKWVKLIQYIVFYKENIVIVFFFENEEEYFD